MTPRLSEATLAQLPGEVQRPRYDRSKLESGIVHIGIGAFHRAHQAPLFDALAASGDLRWGIRAASLRSPAVREAMAPQDWLYSLVIDEDSERSVRAVGAIREVIVAPENPRRLVEALAAPETALVTVTVTEKGYKLDRETNALDEDDLDVRHDLASLTAPRTMPGFIAAGLRLRRERGLSAPTIISCDNLPSNGRKLRNAVARMARGQEPGLADWIEETTAFPDSMVDRIVPATQAGDVARLAQRTGLLDRAMVRTEPFFQWVIEDRFAGPRPELEAAGVQLTDDVAPWEEAKLRLLNGAHSAMAYLGGLAGIETVDAFVSQDWGAAFVDRLWEELEPTLTPPAQFDAVQYCTSLMRRFANSALQHRLRQIAMDGSQKIPQRLLAPAGERLERGDDVSAIALAVAAWIRWQGGATDNGERFEVDDPLAGTTARLLSGARSAREQVRAMFGLRAVFPERLAADAGFERELVRSLEDLQRFGARASAERLLQKTRRSSGT